MFSEDKIKKDIKLELNYLNGMAKREGFNNVDPIEKILKPLEPKIRKENGKINIWWVIFNIGVIIARILAVIDFKKTKLNS